MFFDLFFSYFRLWFSSFWRWYISYWSICSLPWWVIPTVLWPPFPMNGLGKNLVLYFFFSKNPQKIMIEWIRWLSTVFFIASGQWLKSKHQMSKVFFIIVAIRKEKRPGCLLFFQIATTKTITTKRLTFGVWFFSLHLMQ